MRASSAGEVRPTGTPYVTTMAPEAFYARPTPVWRRSGRLYNTGTPIDVYGYSFEMSWDGKLLYRIAVRGSNEIVYAAFREGWTGASMLDQMLALPQFHVDPVCTVQAPETFYLRPERTWARGSAPLVTRGTSITVLSYSLERVDEKRIYEVRLADGRHGYAVFLEQHMSEAGLDCPTMTSWSVAPPAVTPAGPDETPPAQSSTAPPREVVRSAALPPPLNDVPPGAKPTQSWGTFLALAGLAVVGGVAVFYNRRKLGF